MNGTVRWVAAGIVGSCLLAMVASGSAYAQQLWPKKEVYVVVPAATGGTTDALGRLVAKKMGENLKQVFIVENRAGAGGMIGGQRVSKAPPDGYTLMISGTYQLGAQTPTSDNPSAFDQIKHFTHIAYFGGAPYVLVVNPAVPAKDLKELLAYTQSMRDGLSWGSSGVGGQAHLLGEAFRGITKANMVHIPYKSAGPAILDLVARQIPAAFVTFSTAAAYIRSGTVRPIAITSSRRVPDYPDLATFAEQGYPQIVGLGWFGLSAPPDLPKPLTDLINAEVQRALAAPEIKKFMADQNIETTPMDSTEYTRFIASEIARFAPK